MVPNRSAGAAWALTLAFACTGWAQQFSFRHYGIAEGLKNQVILSLAQDRAGYLWAGTEGGLYRYDGTHFRLMGPDEGMSCAGEVRTVYVASDGGVWANACARIFRYDGRRFHLLTGAGGLLSGSQRMAEDVHGHLVVSTADGLFEALPDGSGSF
ncbi:MAG: hypothetical protein NTY38_31220, partial [Acidobacteria bacterium]|nr:hypothetical protein [Acidobacteriota bacterium]